MDNYKLNIGKKVTKTHKPNCIPKPFKSTFKVNTIKDVIEHPMIGGPAYTFLEDDSYVSCKGCLILDEINNPKLISWG